MLNDYAFKLNWNEMPEDWREKKIEEVRENLVEQGKENYRGEYEARGKSYGSLEVFVREEIWTPEDVETHITNHFPIHF